MVVSLHGYLVFLIYFTLLSPGAVSGNRIYKLPIYLSLQSVKQQNAMWVIMSALLKAYVCHRSDMARS